MSWAAWAAIILLLPVAAIALGAWYALAVPGTAHEGPLPEATAEEYLGLGKLVPNQADGTPGTSATDHGR